MRTYTDVEDMLVKAKEMLDKIDIPYNRNICPRIVEFKAFTFFAETVSLVGASERIKNKYGKYDYYIRFNQYTLDMTEKATMNTLLHELCHTCDGCLNHGKKWKEYVGLVNETYGFNISMLDGDKTKEDKELLNQAKIEHSKNPHKWHCPKCGQVWVRTRKTKYTEHPEKFKCGGCQVRLVKDF